MRIYLELILLGFLTSLLFPPYFIIPLGFIVFPYLFFKIIKDKYKENLKLIFFRGFFYGLVLNLSLFFWLKEPFLIDASTKNFFFLSYILIFYIAIYSGILFVVIKLFKDESIQILIFPIIFVILEILRTKLFISFPWNLMAYTFSDNAKLFYISKYIGVYGVSYFALVIFLIPVLIINIFNNKNLKFNLFYLLSIFIFIIIFYLYSFILEKEEKIENYSNLDIIIHQNNIPQDQKWNFNKSKNRLEDLNLFIKNNSNNIIPTLIISSETEIPYMINKNDKILNGIQLLLDNNTTVIIGAIREDQENNSYYNSMYLIDSNRVEYFDKKILVPFGEYVPLKNLFPFIKKLSFISSEFTKGDKERKLKLMNGQYIIPTICYENIFFDKIINKRNYESNLIINITNDSWFGKYQGPQQHFYHSIMRSIDLNKYLIRVSNNGISAIVDPQGKILYSTSLNKKQISKFNLNFYDNENYTYFKYKYNIFYSYLLIVLIICFFYQFFRRNE